MTKTSRKDTDKMINLLNYGARELDLHTTTASGEDLFNNEQNWCRHKSYIKVLNEWEGGGQI